MHTRRIEKGWGRKTLEAFKHTSPLLLTFARVTHAQPSHTLVVVSICRAMAWARFEVEITHLKIHIQDKETLLLLFRSAQRTGQPRCILNDWIGLSYTFQLLIERQVHGGACGGGGAAWASLSNTLQTSDRNLSTSHRTPGTWLCVRRRRWSWPSLSSGYPSP